MSSARPVGAPARRFADARTEYLQQQYGKQLLRDLAREADEAFKATSSKLGTDAAPTGAKADYARAKRAVETARPTEAESASLRKLVERHGLEKGDAAADARDLTALRRRALDKAGVADDDPPDAEDAEERAGFEDPLRGRLIRGPFDPWPEVKRADKVPSRGAGNHTSRCLQDAFQDAFVRSVERAWS